MSIENNDTELDCTVEQGCDAIELIIQPRETDLGDFKVKRLLPTRARKMVGPWIFFDHMGPAQFGPGQGVNVRPHPHINLATVTYLFDGEILHRDSLGSKQCIRPGDINLMVAGSGITHSERERPEVTDSVHHLDGLQLWLALPVADEEIAPAFYHYPAGEIPALNVSGVAVRVLIGEAYGVRSPVKTFANTLYVEAQLKAGQSLVLPDAPERALYLVSGSVSAKDTELTPHCMAVFNDTPKVSVRANTDSRLAIIGGDNVGPRFINWNFISSRKERIEQARQDWAAGRFAKVVDDEEEFIPLPP
ncbi:pirin family protein [Rheinheimera sp. FR7-31]|uniref:pirin family protein n=1 Tax=Rheinheimera fenheensis TaxID=3152295 RepID=UPI00325C8B8F